MSTRGERIHSLNVFDPLAVKHVSIQFRRVAFLYSKKDGLTSSRARCEVLSIKNFFAREKTIGGLIFKKGIPIFFSIYDRSALDALIIGISSVNPKYSRDCVFNLSLSKSFALFSSNSQNA